MLTAHPCANHAAPHTVSSTPSRFGACGPSPWSCDDSAWLVVNIPYRDGAVGTATTDDDEGISAE